MSTPMAYKQLPTQAQQGLELMVGWLAWFGLLIGVAALITIGAALWTAHSNGEFHQRLGEVTKVLIGAVIITSAGVLAQAVLISANS